jgi:hypothetical protein
MPRLPSPVSSVTTLLLSCALAASLATTACSGNGGSSGGSGGSSGSGGSTSSGGSGGGPVSGPADTHCGSTSAKVDPAACMGGGGSGGGTTTTTTTTSGTATDTGGSEYGPTLYNAEGDDDDCKYHVKFTSTSIAENKDVTFTVTVTSKSDGTPVTGAAPDIEAYLSDIHPAPNTDQKPTEKGMGVYDIGPVKFDAAGKWTVRFHFFESCNDGETSPHGHVAFYLDVP